MLKKTIKYINFDNEEKTGTYYFNLTKAELTELEFSIGGRFGLTKYVEKIVEEKDSKKIMELFKEIILMAYGVKSDDGERFEKSEKLILDFSHTQAYSELFIELATNTDAAVEFINGIIPQGLKLENN